MPRIAVTDTPQRLLRSTNGNYGRPTRVVGRIDPDDETSVVWIGRNADVTPGTNAATDGVPVLPGEPWDDDRMIDGEEWWIVMVTGTVDFYYDYQGGRADLTQP